MTGHDGCDEVVGHEGWIQGGRGDDRTLSSMNEHPSLWHLICFNWHFPYALNVFHIKKEKENDSVWVFFIANGKLSFIKDYSYNQIGIECQSHAGLPAARQSCGAGIYPSGQEHD